MKVAHELQMKEYVMKTLLDSSLPWIPALKYLEQKAKFKRLYTFYSFATVLTLWLIFGETAQLLCNSIGFFYPAYVTIGTIKSSRLKNTFKWLIYWVVYAAFSWLEHYSDQIVQLFPLYWLAKCFLLLCLMVCVELNEVIILHQNSVVSSDKKNRPPNVNNKQQGKNKKKNNRMQGHN
ncbi:receptor expression-enhancing protein 5-like [Aethina tumida]|uniref:receptor expression-enhancing protein 5-like n=1 Tax=Aethina tumida TaxID=116153 RepID=UPI002147330F|nr:receptor expression-enhancing protein 5-like [Aethina tumida]